MGHTVGAQVRPAGLDVTKRSCAGSPVPPRTWADRWIGVTWARSGFVNPAGVGRYFCWGCAREGLVGLVAPYGLDTGALAVPNGEVDWFPKRSRQFFLLINLK